MNESWELRVYDHAGEIVAACRDLETAIGLLCLSDVGATIWLGVSRPQRIYTLVENEDFILEWSGRGSFISLAVEVVTETLYQDWDSVVAVYSDDAERIGVTWWRTFQEFVWQNADPELRELADQEEEAYMTELLKERIAQGKTEETESELTTIRDLIRNIDDEQDPDGLPTLPPVESL